MKTIQDIKEERNMQLQEELIKLKDVSVINIVEDEVHETGCETCDYWSRYGIEYTIHFSDGTTVEVELTSMYDSPISEGQLIVFFANNLKELQDKTKEEFLALFENPELITGVKHYGCD